MVKKILIILCAFFAVDYYGDASRRANAHVWESDVSTADGGLYTALYTVLTDELMLIRLYKTGDKSLLAERTFIHMDIPRISWDKDKLFYSTNDSSLFYDGFIHLPPRLIDKVLAHLP